MNLPRFASNLENVYNWGNKHSGGALEIIRRAVQRFNRVQGPSAAASIAYYAVFSLFPLLLFLTSIIGYILVITQSPQDVLNFITYNLPIPPNLIQENLGEILKQRSTSGVIGLLGLIWAASGVFLTLSRNINRAWPGASMRNFLSSRLLAVGMVAILAILLILAFVINLIINLIAQGNLPIPISSSPIDSTTWSLITQLLPWLIAFFVFLSLYRWIPNTRVHWSEAFWGAIIATIGWELATKLFTWYLGSGLARFELLYGSLSTSVALLIWIYLSAFITLFGAHISASVAARKRPIEPPSQEKTDNKPK